MHNSIKLQLVSWAYTLRRMYITRFPYVRHVCLILNNYCNLQCDFCDLWKSKPTLDLQLTDIKKFFNTLTRAPLDIQISGGEPFLRTDLSDIVNQLTSEYPRSKFMITTNGIATDDIQKSLYKIDNVKRLHLSLSMNGLENTISEGNDSAHVRAFTSTLNLLNEKFPRVVKTLKMLVRNFDIEVILYAYEYAKRHNAYFQLKFEERALSYTNQMAQEEDVRYFEKPPFMRRFSASEKRTIIDGIENFLGKTRYDAAFKLFNRLYLMHVQRYLSESDTYRHLCPVPGNYIMMMPDGTINPCRYLSMCAAPSQPDYVSDSVMSLDAFKNNLACPYPYRACLSFWNFFI